MYFTRKMFRFISSVLYSTMPNNKGVQVGVVSIRFSVQRSDEVLLHLFYPLYVASLIQVPDYAITFQSATDVRVYTKHKEHHEF